MTRKKDEEDKEQWLDHPPSKSEELIALFGTRHNEVLNRVTMINFQSDRASKEIEATKAELSVYTTAAVDATIDMYLELRQFFETSNKRKHRKEIRIGHLRYYTVLDVEDKESLQLIILVNRLIKYTKMLSEASGRALETVKWGKRGGKDMILKSYVKKGIPYFTITTAHNSDLESLCEDDLNA